MPLSIIRIFLAFSSAVLLILSFPKFNLGFLAWIGLVPLLLAIRNLSPLPTVALCYLTGVSFFRVIFDWINFVNGVSVFHLFIIGAYLGFYFGIFGLLLNLLSRKTTLPLLITAPFLWVSAEYLRANAGFLRLPWALLGHTQYQNLPFLQMVSFTGAYGISFVVMVANSAIADIFIHCMETRKKGTPEKRKVTWLSNPLYRGVLVLLIISTIWFAGWMSIPREHLGKSLSISVVQGNIAQKIKWKREYREQIISKYENLTEEAARSNPKLIVWPEASTPGFILNDTTLYQRMVSMVRRTNTYLLAGSAEYPKFGKKPIKLKSGNTALLFSPEGKILGQYLKIYLIPFGEYIPYEGIILWPEFIVPKGTNSNVAGNEFTLFQLDGTRFGTLICSEIIYPHLARTMVKQGANFMVNISNEAWFGRSPFPYQFLCQCIFRSVENRVNFVRATNTGISSFIDPYGRITAKLSNGGQELFVEGSLTRDVILSPAGTFYTRHGDVFAYGCIAFSMGLVGMLVSKKITRMENDK